LLGALSLPTYAGFVAGSDADFGELPSTHSGE
jgi:hypothetical protein